MNKKLIISISAVGAIIVVAIAISIFIKYNNTINNNRILLKSAKKQMLTDQKYTCSYTGKIIGVNFIPAKNNTTNKHITIYVDDKHNLHKGDILHFKEYFSDKILTFYNKDKTIKTAIKYNVTIRQNQLMMLETNLHNPLSLLYTCNINSIN